MLTPTRRSPVLGFLAPDILPGWWSCPRCRTLEAETQAGQGLERASMQAQSPGWPPCLAWCPRQVSLRVCGKALTFHQRLEDDGLQLLGAVLFEVVHGEQVWVGGDVLQLWAQDKGREVAPWTGSSTVGRLQTQCEWKQSWVPCM